jgi:hypothetical protein
VDIPGGRSRHLARAVAAERQGLSVCDDGRLRARSLETSEGRAIC